MYTFDDVAEFISEQAGAEKTKINPESRLVENLGIDGDDFFELEHAFANWC
jgi:acyl carrier protein